MSQTIIPVEKLKAFMHESLTAVGVPYTDADIVVDILIASDLRGIESHGIGRLKMYIDRINDGRQMPTTNFEILRDSPGTALIDGHHGMGHVIAHKAMSLALEKAEKVGIAAVSVRNGTHFGIAGYYPKMAIQKGMAGMAFTNARPSISPTFGHDPLLGTNPIAFGVPTDEECPFLLDMATSITQRGKIEVADRKQKPVPEGWAIDMEGEFVTDPTKMLKLFREKAASLLPLGGATEELAGYKGYGLAVMVEILSSAFSGGPFGWGLVGFDKEGNKQPFCLGHFFIAINISHFLDLDEFKKISGNIIRSMRESGKLPNADRIWTAGEKEYDNEKRIQNEGIFINENLKEEMIQLKKEMNLKSPLPF
jgi:L-2-hydroxycarboxylate dehydrogenase (NAD+)